MISNLPQFTRLSNDEIVNEKHGLYGVDYPAEDDLYQQYLGEADTVFHQRLRALLEEGRNVVLDRSLYAKEDRDELKQIIGEYGGHWVLIFLKAADKEKLWARIQDRSAQPKEANSALDISRDTFEMYWDGFEDPHGEGEIVIGV